MNLQYTSLSRSQYIPELVKSKIPKYIVFSFSLLSISTYSPFHYFPPPAGYLFHRHVCILILTYGDRDSIHPINKSIGGRIVIKKILIRKFHCIKCGRYDKKFQADLGGNIYISIFCFLINSIPSKPLRRNVLLGMKTLERTGKTILNKIMDKPLFLFKTI